MCIAELIHPSLSQVRPELRAGLLHRARRTPLDVVELLGTAAALIGVIIAERQQLTVALIAAGTAIALLLVRRTRRGLRQAIDEQRATRVRPSPVAAP